MNIVPYSQNDSRWANLPLGNTSIKIKTAGCYIVSISMLLRKIPSIVLETLNKNECFNSEGCLLNDKAAQILNMVYSKVLNDPKKLCVAETDHFKDKGYPQHFFVWLNNNQFICDPLDGRIKKNPYHIVSYRLWDKRSST